MDLNGKFVDGFILPLSDSNAAAYKEFSTKAGEIWMEHGALQYVECIGVDVPFGKLTSFPRAVLLKEGETVVFAWIVYESREHRDRVNAAVFADPRMHGLSPDGMPFDGKRMIFGGFQTLLAF